MANTVEVCYVRLKSRLEHTGPSASPSIHYDRYVAEKVSPAGTETVAQTDEFKTLDTSGGQVAEGMEYANALLREAYQRMLQGLFDAGWEVLTTDDYGQAASLKREIGTSVGARSGDSADTLRQLAALRDQGILTEQEFQAKKAEVLRRM